VSDRPDIRDDAGAAGEPPERESRDLRGVPTGSGRKERQRDAGLRESRLADLNSALAVHDVLRSQMEKAASELKAALLAAAGLEAAERAPEAEGRRLASSVKSVLEALSTASSLASDAAESARKRESSLLGQHEEVCSRMDAAARELQKSLAAASVLDRSSGSGHNVEVRLGRRLGVKDILRILHAAHSQVVRAARMSRARAGSHGPAVEDLIRDVPAGFE